MTGENADILNPSFETWQANSMPDYYMASDVYDPNGFLTSGEVTVSEYDNGDGTSALSINVIPNTSLSSGDAFCIRQYPIACSIAPTFMNYTLKVIYASPNYSVNTQFGKDIFGDIVVKNDVSSTGTFNIKSDEDGEYGKYFSDRTWTKSSMSDTYGVEGFVVGFEVTSNTSDSMQFVIDDIQLINNGRNNNIPDATYYDSSTNDFSVINTKWQFEIVASNITRDGTCDIQIETVPPFTTTFYTFYDVTSSDTLVCEESLDNGNTLVYELDMEQIFVFDDGIDPIHNASFNWEKFYIRNDSQEYYVDFAYGSDNAFEGNSYGQPKQSVSSLSSIISDGSVLNIQPGYYIDETQWSPTNAGTTGITYTINEFADTSRTTYDDVVLHLGKWIIDGNFVYSPWGKYVEWIWKGIGDTYNGGIIGYYVDDCTLISTDTFLPEGYVLYRLVDSDGMHEIHAGYSLILIDGYKIDVNDVSYDGVAYVEVVKDGNVIDSLVDVTDGYEYVLYTTIQGNDYPTLAFHVWNVYYSSEYTSVTFDGLWQTSDYAELIS